MTNFIINVIANAAQAETAIRRVEQNLTAVERRALAVNRILSAALTATAIGGALTAVTNLADGFTNIQNRLKLVTNGTEQLNAATDRLFQISQNTRQSFRSTAETYTRVAAAAKSLGLESFDAFKFTESLNKVIATSGATTIEAERAMLQLSQGFASGVLRGDELRSVLEQLPAVADVIAKEFNVSRGAVRSLGEQGLITSQRIVDAFNNAAEEIDQKFGRTVPTIGQAFTVFTNSLTLLVGSLNQATGIFSLFAQALITVGGAMGTLAANMQIVAPVLTVIIARFVALQAAALLATTSVGGFVTAFRLGVTTMGLFTASSIAATGALTLLRNALISLAVSNPFTLIATAIAFAIGLFLQFNAQITFFVNTFISLVQPVINAFVTALNNAGISFSFLGSIANFVLDFIAATITFIILNIQTWGQILQGVGAIFQWIGEQVSHVATVLYELFGPVIALASGAIAVLREEFSGLFAVIDGVISVIKALIDFIIGIGRAAAEAAGITVSKWQEIRSSTDQTTGSVNNLAGSFTKVKTEAADAGATAVRAIGSVGDSALSQVPKVEALADSFRNVAAAADDAAAASSRVGSGGGRSKGGGSTKGTFSDVTDIRKIGKANLGLLLRIATDSQKARAEAAGQAAARGEGGSIFSDLGGNTGFLQKLQRDAFTQERLRLEQQAQRAAADPAGEAVRQGPNVFGFASGGSFRVGGSGGTDSQLVRFMASPNERVTVETPSQQRKKSKENQQPQQNNIVINIRANNPADFRQSEPEIAARIGREIARYNRRQA